MSVTEAVQLSKEADGLLADAPPEERQWVQSEINQDPYYNAAILGTNTLRGILEHLAQRIADDQIPPIQEEQGLTEIHVETRQDNSLDELLADLEDDHELIADRAEQQKKDIADIHSFLDSYQAELANNTVITKSRRAALRRFLNSEYKKRWSGEQLADDPIRLKNILDSIHSKTGISEITRNDIRDCILKSVKEHVAATTASVDPDIISRRIEASLLPGLSSGELQQVLLCCYFRTAEMYADVGLVVDSYERFIRGGIRLASKPEVMRQAMKIASFDTYLLPDGGLYAHKVKAVPLLRLDRPEYFGRAFACLQGIYILTASLDALDKLPPARPNPLNEFSGYIKKLADSGKPIRPSSVITKHYHGLSVAHFSMALKALGEEEYQRRSDALDDYMDLYRDPSKVVKATLDIQLSEQEDPGFDIYTSQAKYVARYLITKHPGLADFFKVIFETDYAVSAEASAYIGDQTLKMTQTLHDQEYMAKLEPALRQAMERRGGRSVRKALKKAGNLGEFLKDIVENQTETAARRTDDGFVVEVFISKGNVLTDEDWLGILGHYSKQIEKAKNEITRTTGIGRRAVNIGDAKEGFLLIVREESHLDKQTYHPLDDIIGEANSEKLEYAPEYTLRALGAVEASRLNILATQRRFLNRRGISWQKDFVGGDKLTVNLHKHPRNPQNFVCEVLSADGGNITRAKVLMNGELAFLLGDRKVRNTQGLAELNALAAEILERFMCQEAVESEEGQIGNEKNTVTARIAHLRLLPEGQSYSYDRWVACLETEGLDLEVLSNLQQIKYNTDRKSTYVQAVERDDISLGPLRVFLEI